MHVRLKKNRSGSISVVVDKSSGRHKESHPIGIANDESEVVQLRQKGWEWIGLCKLLKYLELDPYGEERRACEYEMEMTERVAVNIDKILINDAFFAIKTFKIHFYILKYIINTSY